MNNETNNNYVYPVGDFLSGFSKDLKTPCDLELMCQKMVILGLKYLDKNPELYEWMCNNYCSVSDDTLKPLVDSMTIDDNTNLDYRKTDLMIQQAVVHSFHAKNMGWDNYIKFCVDGLNKRLKTTNN
jgi:hypothetical protein